MAARVAFFVLAIAVLLVRNHAESPVIDSEAIRVADFSYGGSTGPENWGSLSPEYAACSAGKLQSPVDITTAEVVHNKALKPLKRKYFSVNATLINYGFNVAMEFGDAGRLTINDKNYTLSRMHWHTPSEHTINGVRYDAELHLVHMADDGSHSVVAFLYKVSSDDDPILSEIQNKLVKLGEEKAERVEVGTFDIWKLSRNTRNYYRYHGSLTTPPCSEDVIWNVFAKVKEITKEQVLDLKAPLKSNCKDNSRPVQPLNDREIELFDELKY
ncbi:alpha carbonic anhydrase 1, chloroplastic [Diospyros lotus]|uniref:alpha carbonic anhydrase 1, chloroplastic n=1 Tax=Diospyros lotus TaxID=55363 RepID=UPI0022575648|nr:alpha carbonic anhydrase 1, chloroplastic [Diospyros lotus]